MVIPQCHFPMTPTSTLSRQDRHLSDRQNRTPLMLAAAAEHRDIVRVLGNEAVDGWTVGASLVTERWKNGSVKWD